MEVDVFGSIVAIVVMLLVMAFLISIVVSLLWLYRDAERRGKTGCMWLLIAFFTWPWGVIAYYLLRDKQVTL
ncbi:MAG: hypothetical protein ABI670_02210 [Chloroflexota bacterium]